MPHGEPNSDGHEEYGHRMGNELVERLGEAVSGFDHARSPTARESSYRYRDTTFTVLPWLTMRPADKQAAYVQRVLTASML